MASLRRNNNPTNNETAKFLYSILKQLDHKSVDWTEVAHDIGITNGHAARMRFSRFKQAMEGTVPTTRKSKETHQQKKTKVQKKGKKEEVLAEEKGKVKPEPGLESSAFDGTAENGEVAVKTEEAGEEIVVKAEPGIKEEDTTDDGFYGSSHGYFQGQSQLYQAPEEMQM